jgi:general secretion pathway protein D
MGFVNYGTPITDGVSVLTENRIPQPIFETRQLSNINITLYSGTTATVGGLLKMESTKVEDKVPVFGDLPVLGRFFRSNVERHRRRALVFMVKAEVIDPSGQVVTSTASAAPAGK